MCSRAVLNRTRFAKQREKKPFSPYHLFSENHYSFAFLLSFPFYPHCCLLCPAGEDV